MNKEKKTVRSLQWFPKEGGYLVDEEDITHLSGIFLNELLDINNEEDPHLEYGGYDVPEDKFEAIQPYIKHHLDNQKYIYQMSTYYVVEPMGEDEAEELVAHVKWIRPDSEDFEGAEDLTHLSLSFLKDLLPVKQEHMAFEDSCEGLFEGPGSCYAHIQHTIESLQPYIKHKVDKEKYRYVVGCYRRVYKKADGPIQKK